MKTAWDHRNTCKQDENCLESFGRRRWRRRMRKREKCQSGTAGKTHSEGPWVLHCSLVVSFIKIWVGFPSSLSVAVVVSDQLLSGAAWEKVGGRERESGKQKKYILVGCGNQILSWTSISSVSVCLSLFGRLSLRCLALSASVPLAANFDLPSMATAAAICVYM